MPVITPIEAAKPHPRMVTARILSVIDVSIANEAKIEKVKAATPAQVATHATEAAIAATEQTAAATEDPPAIARFFDIVSKLLINFPFL